MINFRKKLYRKSVKVSENFRRKKNMKNAWKAAKENV